MPVGAAATGCGISLGAAVVVASSGASAVAVLDEVDIVLPVATNLGVIIAVMLCLVPLFGGGLTMSLTICSDS